MRRLFLAWSLVCTMQPLAAAAQPEEAARRLYAAFVRAQNAHDFAGVRATLLDSPRFLWVSNGLSVWGADAALSRMQEFHAAETWRIAPRDDRAQAVAVGPDAAFLHIPLELTHGPAAAPARYRILVSALCRRTPDGWRIAALFTADANPEEWRD